MNVNKLLVTFFVISVAANIGAFVLLRQDTPDVKSAQDYAALEERYSFLSKRVLMDLPADLLLNFLALRNELTTQVTPYGDTFGLTFEYLPTGTAININGNNKFYAASLFKVPVIMAYYHGRERLHLTDDPTIVVKQDQLDSEFGNLWKKGAGTKLKASEAIRLALVESDNTAIKALIPYVEDEDFKTVYNGLDLNLSSTPEGALISTREYATILKALYFSSVLNKDDSQAILSMLSESSFSNKLVAGVLPGTLVAHKIGDFKDENKEGYRDCGIVYVPRRQYLLCMYSTSNEATANERMKVVSKIIYDYVSTLSH